jgi:6-phosphofructokinase 1
LFQFSFLKNMSLRDSNISLPALLLAASATGSLTTLWISHYLRKKHETKLIRERLERRRKEIILNKSLQDKEKKENAPNIGTLIQNLKIDEVYLWKIQSLTDCFESEATPETVNRMYGVHGQGSATDADDFAALGTSYNQLIAENECILADLVRNPNKDNGHSIGRTVAYVRAGPRERLHFNPKTVNAAIVTCGGLCPGLNNVVREITNTLFNLYGVGGKVYGVRGGYKGFYEIPPMELTPSVVENIHHAGGTILGSSRGGFDLDKILSFLRQKSIKQLYVIGGDGTHRGAYAIHEGCLKAGLNVAVAGIPKTIDNDVDYIDRSFGFESAVEAAQNAIRVAKTEAYCNLPNGIGIVKLMGRSAGFIAVHATLSSGDVDLCLVPEVPIVLDGLNGCLPHLYKVVKSKGFAVVVVAEGAGEELLGVSAEKDASGNKKLPPIGEYMKKVTEKYFETKGEACTVK